MNSEDADRAVIERLHELGFDFSKKAKIDFEIEFDHWPLSVDEKSRLIQLYPTAIIHEPDEEEIAEGYQIGYVECRFERILTLDFVITIQQEITEELEHIGGVCKTWSVSLA